jgi:hypothetical protein
MAGLPDLSQAWTLKEAIDAFADEKDLAEQKQWLKETNREAKKAKNAAWELKRIKDRTPKPTAKMIAEFEAAVARHQAFERVLDDDFRHSSEPILRGLMDALRAGELIAYGRLDAPLNAVDAIPAEIWRREWEFNFAYNTASARETPSNRIFSRIFGIRFQQDGATRARTKAPTPERRRRKSTLLQTVIGIMLDLYPPDGLSFGSRDRSIILDEVNKKLPPRKTASLRTLDRAIHALGTSESAQTKQDKEPEAE